MTRPLSTANRPTLFLIHRYPLLLASCARAEAPRDEEVLLVTTLSVPSLLFRPQPTRLRLLHSPRHPCVRHPLRPLVRTIALPGPRSKPSHILLTATTIFRT